MFRFEDNWIREYLQERRIERSERESMDELHRD